MPRFRRCFRTHALPAPGFRARLPDVRNIVGEALSRANFFLKPGASLEWDHTSAEVIPWEIYRGRVLDAAQTRLRQEFEAWNVYWLEDGDRSAEPLLSVKLDEAGHLLHVVRAVHCYAWEGYDAGDNVFLSRETCKWIRELVGTLSLESLADPGDLRDEIICLLFHAVVGSSRLPLTSVEAPLPSFSLGQLAYFYRRDYDPVKKPSFPMQSFSQLISQGLHGDLNWLETAKLLEILLRSISPEEVAQVSELFVAQWFQLGHSQQELMSLCRTMFNEVALSPYTAFVGTFLAFLDALVEKGRIRPDQHVDVLSYVLRQNARHLTAYDLHTFHHQGANYPDALLLDAVLSAYLGLIEQHSELFVACPGDDTPQQKNKRIRRRAFRQAWLLRSAYEGLPIPEQPTSPGENQRVLPPPHKRVPEEQIYIPAKRTRRLFVDHLIARAPAPLLRQCFIDLECPEELQELGMALFLDRPLGAFKTPGESDQTLLLSYEMFSRSIAQRRLERLDRDLGLATDMREVKVPCECRLSQLQLTGLSVRSSAASPRPGVVSLDDARKAADDFVILNTTRRTVRDFIHQFDLTPLARRLSLDYLDGTRRVLIVRAKYVEERPEDSLLVYDAQLRKRLELGIDLSFGYGRGGGQEYPVAGLRAVRAWEPRGEDMAEHNLHGIPIPVRD
jgi:hypothetical protein